MLNDGKNPNNKRIEKRSVSLNVYMMLLIGRDAKKKRKRRKWRNQEDIFA